MVDNDAYGGGDDGDARRTHDASLPNDDVAGDATGDTNPGDDDTPDDRASQLNMYLSDEGDVLDLTGNQLKDLAGIPLPPTLTDLDLTTNRLAALDPRIGGLERLEKISFRQNLLTDAAVAGLKELTRLTLLKDLVLRDNLLKKVPCVSSLPALTLLDLSYNHIHAMAPLASAPACVRELYLANNRIGTIEALDGFSQLRLLELGSNKIREMENLAHLSALEELWVGRNKIKEVRVAGLTSLVKISVQSNRLTSMLGFQACTRLQELYLSNNGIATMEGLEVLTNLRILDLAANAIAHVQGLDTLTKLEDLWLNDNRIESLTQLMAALEGPKASLVTLYLERNPCAKEAGYIETLAAMLPKAEEIDSKPAR
ncbi:hypothetical protein CLOP_g18947 [Closterium sp. NIES-67]|nr:hypothetical protein CLOP_g18947 [Closterium sp. NIES-67]